jgi:hypothetical protein
MRNALVDYSSSDEEIATATAGSAFPSLPKELDAVYAVKPRKGHDSAFHGGKQRVMPHTEGLWPTHIQLDVKLSAQQRAWLTELLGAADQVCQVKHESLLVSELGVEADLHISLSRSAMLSGQVKESFQAEMSAAASAQDVGFLHFKPTRIASFENTDGGRRFLVIQLQALEEQLYTKLMPQTDAVMLKYGIAPLYPREERLTGLHASIGWTLATGARPSARSLARLQNHKAMRCLQADPFSCSTLRIKVGNEIDLVELGLGK